MTNRAAYDARARSLRDHHLGPQDPCHDREGGTGRGRIQAMGAFEELLGLGELVACIADLSQVR